VTLGDASTRPPHHSGYVHDLLLYGSDEELVEVTLPFILSGADAGEPVMVRDGTPAGALVRAALGASPAVTWFDGDGGRPAASMMRMLALARRLVDDGAPGVRVLGQLPLLRADGAAWEQWAAYEAIANHALAGLPLWSLCAYDRRALGPDLVDAANRTHPTVTAAAGRAVNAGYLPPVAFLDGIPPAPPDPVEATEPDVELVDVDATHPLRVALAGLGEGLLEADALSDLGIAVSEVAANGLHYGRPPVVARMWRRPDRLVVTVRDLGDGPAPLRRGWLPPLDHRVEGGYGLWISRQCCDELDIRVDGSGCTVRLVTWAAGRRPGPPPRRGSSTGG
jgi:anti-sigma regulatory factor (Ser/Thr protein kinase)